MGISNYKNIIGGGDITRRLPKNTEYVANGDTNPYIIAFHAPVVNTSFTTVEDRNGNDLKAKMGLGAEFEDIVLPVEHADVPIKTIEADQPLLLILGKDI